MRSVLVTGGSIAGPATAWALKQAGLQPVLLERAPRARTAGQNVDIREDGRTVIDRMGLRDAVLAARTGELGTRFVNHEGRVDARFPVEEGRDGPTAELEILRGDLAELLLGLTRDEIPHRYGDHVTALAQDASGVDVTLASGKQERYDLLVVAEGRRSKTRGLLFGDEVGYRDLGEYVAYGTIDRLPPDDDWWEWLTATGSRMVSVRPDAKGTMRATLAFLAPPLGLDSLGFDAQMHALRARYADVPQAQRVLDGFAARPEEFYLERFEQVRLPSWTRGRVALVGDAAWASGPSGLGTTLGLVGAYVLGEQLRERPLPEAFAAYERLMRPYAEKAQDFPPGVPRLFFPRTKTGLRVLSLAHRLSATAPARRLTDRVLLNRAQPQSPLREMERAASAGPV
ncbi:FAD-dependent monooxygenase [Kineosporia succinea]|uniref:2-polyprenyl-6-methoxyphenol hydroxylase-like FAD-dependent oxidoreductase n=1 Tax=Kineosporia succinea TaxID=84632 RepID=A0ABT9PD96_9ACTN|nr:FAD-dependent monooxygenase [Kineosporia succinea]MDP9830679.1 2-polyprenyl-6-methoxyphenol hydroxylase-like FAD-dependent oxidoreductase [Kineosporia succinea]